MKAFLLTIICIVVFASTSLAYTEPKERQKFMKETEKNFKLNKIINEIKNGDIPQRHLQILYLVLQNTPEVYIHNMNGVTGNNTYVHKDGHREAVYDKDGNVVKDGINDASYNYFARRKAPLKHFSFDTHPWIIWGNSQQDSTTRTERIFALVGDIQIGLKAALANKGQLQNIQQKWDRDGQLQALAIFVLAQRKGNSKPIYELFELNNATIEDREIIDVLEGLGSGLNIMYNSRGD